MMFEVGQRVRIALRSWDEFCSAYLKHLPRNAKKFTSCDTTGYLAASAAGYSAPDFYKLRRMSGVIELDFECGWYIVDFGGERAWFYETMLRSMEEAYVDKEALMDCLLL